MAVRYAIATGDWSNSATWNDGGVLGIPTTGDDVWANSFTVNVNQNITVNSLNNSARARDIATPAMTANNAPSPYVAAASTQGSGLEAWRAFDRNYSNSTNYWTVNAPESQTGWISMDFGTGIVIDGYIIYGRNDTTRNPRNWTFEGSNNNSTWTVLQTVTNVAGISTYSISSIGNTTSYRYYRFNITANGGVASLSINEIELYQPFTAAIASGGSFNFNTAGVVASVTSSTASLSQGAANLIQVTATTGTVTVNLSSIVTAVIAGNLINYTGNCNLILGGIGYNTSVASGICINKSSTGTITITGNMSIGSSTNTICLNNTAGNVVITGNIAPFAIGSPSGTSTIIQQSQGNLTITGNVVGFAANSVSAITLSGASSVLIVTGNVTGGVGNASTHGINVSAAASVTINGVVTGGTGNGLSFTGNALTINGNVIAGQVAAINTASAITMNVTGDVYASGAANGIVSSSATGTVSLIGNMYNGLGRMAIYCQNIFISNTATTFWRMDTGGGNYKFLYSADTTPNLPSVTNVRFGTTFGPALSLTGTMVVASAANTRKDVPTDNTVGTGELTSVDIISGINASSDPLAVRMKNILTDVTAGNIISQYNNS